MIRAVIEMNVDYETFVKLRIPNHDICPFVTTEECNNEPSCNGCAEKYKDRYIRIISVDIVSTK